MKITHNSKASIKANRQFVDKWYNDINDYPGADPDRFDCLADIDWNINEEDIETILYDSVPLDGVVSVRYITDLDDPELYRTIDNEGFEGGYIFRFRDGSQKTYAWRPYPHNLDPLVEID